MSWVVPLGPSEFRWTQYSKYILLDLRSAEEYAVSHIPYSIHVKESDLYDFQIMDVTEEEYKAIISNNLLSPDNTFKYLPIYNDLSFSCDEGLIDTDVLIKPCKNDYSYFKLSSVTNKYDYQGKIPVLIGNTCDSVVTTAVNVMRAINSPVIVLKGGFLEWVSKSLPLADR